MFAGDCNEPWGAGPATRVFADAGYRDAWSDAGDPADRTASFNGWQEPVDSGERIDWVLTRGQVTAERVPAQRKVAV